MIMKRMTKEDKADLIRAKKFLEKRSFLVTLSEYFGELFSKGFKLLPDNIITQINNSSEKAILSAYNAALLSIKNSCISVT